MPFFIKCKQKPLFLDQIANTNKNLPIMFDSSKQDKARYMEELVSLFKGLKDSVSDRVKEAGCL